MKLEEAPTGVIYLADEAFARPMMKVTKGLSRPYDPDDLVQSLQPHDPMTWIRPISAREAREELLVLRDVNRDVLAR